MSWIRTGLQRGSKEREECDRQWEEERVEKCFWKLFWKNCVESKSPFSILVWLALKWALAGVWVIGCLGVCLLRLLCTTMNWRLQCTEGVGFSSWFLSLSLSWKLRTIFYPQLVCGSWQSEGRRPCDLLAGVALEVWWLGWHGTAQSGVEKTLQIVPWIICSNSV